MRTRGKKNILFFVKTMDQDETTEMPEAICEMLTSDTFSDDPGVD